MSVQKMTARLFRWPWLWALLAVAMPVVARSQDAWWVFFDAAPGPRQIDSLAARGARIRTVSRWLEAVSVSADPGAASRLWGVAGVRAVTAVRRYTRTGREGDIASAPAFDAGSGQFQSEQVRATVLHSLGLSGESVRVGLLDTGFETTHVALLNVRIGGAFDFIHNDEIVSDEPGQDDPGEASHGTRTLSVIGADSPGNFVGIAPHAEFYLAKTEDFTRDGDNFEATIEEDFWVAGLEWCGAHGCRVVSSSLGYSVGYTFSDLDGATAITSRAVTEAARRGILVVTAAGNSDGTIPRGESLRGRIWPPADAFDALTVGGATKTGGGWTLSASGPTADGRIKPDVLALGDGVTVVSTTTDTGYSTARGTSFSTPIAAGVAALLLEAFPMARPHDIIDALRATASQAQNPDARAGYGLINADAAFGFLLGRFDTTPVSTSHRLKSDTLGQVKQRALRAVLAAPHPNPARATSSIAMLVREAGNVQVSVYDLAGRMVCTVLNGELAAGMHSVAWDGCASSGVAVAPGMYIVTLTTSDGVQTRQLMWKGQ